MKKRMRIKIFGKEYTIRSDRDREEVDRIIDYAENTLKKTKRDNPKIPTKELMTLCIMNLCEDYFLLKEDLKEQNRAEELLVENAKYKKEIERLKKEGKEESSDRGNSGTGRQ